MVKILIDKFKDYVNKLLFDNIYDNVKINQLINKFDFIKNNNSLDLLRI